MKKFSIVFGILALVCVVHIYLLFNNGYRPPPEKVMKPTSFSKADEIGAVLARRYWHEIRTEPVVVLGLSPFVPSGRDIWSGFLRTTLTLGVHFDRYFILPTLPLLVEASAPKFERFDWAEVDAALKNGQRLFIFHLSTDASANELSERLTKGLLLLQAPFVVNKESEGLINPVCAEDNEQKWRESAQLSCNALEISRRYYRKKLATEKFVAALEKQGAIKQILYVHEPEIK